jgi:peptidoglycan hydrolase-like protein with peptidoglycan-binding domain
MPINISDPQIQRILTHPDETDSGWRADLQRFEKNDVTLDRRTAAENSVKALQRLLVFLGYSTSASGSYGIDGDFGPGTNRAIAQFQFEYGLNPSVRREMLCYDCTFQTASKNISAVPGVRLDVPTLEKMLAVARQNIDANRVNCGDFEVALFQLNSLHKRRALSCREIHQQYGVQAVQAAARMKAEKGVDIRPEWILSIIRKETEGVVRPKFEQHILTNSNRKTPQEDFSELRYRATSFGLGQVMGFNYQAVGAPSAKAMFYSPLTEQVLFVGKFLTTGGSQIREALAKSSPAEPDFRAVARFYNGPAYEVNRYHESLAKWFAEFRTMIA